MMKIFYVLIVVLLASCSTITPTEIPKFPTQYSKELMTKCADLNVIEHENVPLTELINLIVANYKLYHECSLKTETWIKWYNEQKRLYDAVLNK